MAARRLSAAAPSSSELARLAGSASHLLSSLSWLSSTEPASAAARSAALLEPLSKLEQLRHLREALSRMSTELLPAPLADTAADYGVELGQELLGAAAAALAALDA
eukprot:scaffold155557_cov29-Tisochrysis_lutea.AAC.2